MTDDNLLPDKSVKQAALTRKAPSGSFVSSRSFWLGVSLIIFCGGLDVTYIAEIITGETSAKKAFERLSLSGVCQVDVTDEGELCYNFPSLRLKLDTAEKQYQSLDIKQARQFESTGF